MRALEEQPELMPHLTQLWRGFWQASAARPLSAMGGVGAIPQTEIEAQMRLYRVTDWEAQLEFTAMIRGLDHEYLTFQHEKYEAEEQRKKLQKAGK